MQKTFTVEINNLHYNINCYYDDDCTHYEVFTNCEKLFTLKKGSDGVWKTKENDIIPISPQLIDDIGNAIERHLIF
jgi:hypothetical protein